MIATTRASFTARIALAIALLGCVSLLATAIAGAAATPVYQKETLAEYEKQLSGGQIQSVTVNKRVRSLRVTLKDGRYVLAKYKAKGEPAVVAALQAKGVPVTVLSSSEAAKEKPAKHKLRYIVGGVVIVVLLIVGAVLFIDRKRKAARE